VTTRQKVADFDKEKTRNTGAMATALGERQWC